MVELLVRCVTRAFQKCSQVIYATVAITDGRARVLAQDPVCSSISAAQPMGSLLPARKHASSLFCICPSSPTSLYPPFRPPTLLPAMPPCAPAKPTMRSLMSLVISAGDALLRERATTASDTHRASCPE